MTLLRSMTLLRMMASVLVVAAIVSFSVTANAITLGQVDDFQNGTAQGWRAAGSNPNPPINVADVGMAGVGDNALEIRTNGNGSGAGSRLLGFNDNQWAGDYLAAGVDSISVDLSNPNNVPLNVRFALRGDAGAFVTSDVVVPAGAGVWDNFTFSLDPSDLISVGGTNALETLDSVNELRLLHNPNPSDSGATVGGATAIFAGSLLADNITAVPEPATWAMLSLGGLMIALRRRR